MVENTTKCNNNFLSKYAFINNEEIYIDDYIEKYINNNIKCNLKYKNGHELLCAHGEINKPYI